MSQGTVEPPPVVGKIEQNSPAAKALKPGDVIIAVDGEADQRHLRQAAATRSARRSAPTRARRSSSRCAATARSRPSPAPRSTTRPLKRYRFGFAYDQDASTRPPGWRAPAACAVSQMWAVTTDTVSHIAQIFVPEKRKELGSVVGGYETTRQAIQLDATTAWLVLGADLALARHHQPLPVPAARRRAHLLGAGREGPRQGDPVQRDGARRFHRLRARDRALPRRLDQRPRSTGQRRLQTPVASGHGGETRHRRRDDRGGVPPYRRGSPGSRRGPHQGRRDRAHLGAAARQGRRARRRAGATGRQARRHRRADDLQPPGVHDRRPRGDDARRDAVLDLPDVGARPDRLRRPGRGRPRWRSSRSSSCR